MKHETYLMNRGTEKILIRAHHNAQSLKHEIKQLVTNRHAGGWSLRTMVARGPFLLLCFGRGDSWRIFGKQEHEAGCGCYG